MGQGILHTVVYCSREVLLAEMSSDGADLDDLLGRVQLTTVVTVS